MSPNPPRIDRLTILLVLGIAIAAVIAFWPLIDVVILAVSLAVVILPVQRFFCRFMSGALAALLTTSLIILLVAVSIMFVSMVLAQNADYLTEIVNAILDWVRASPVDRSDPPLPIPTEQIADWLDAQVMNFRAYLAEIASQTPLFVVKVLIFFLALYMLVFRGECVRDEVVAHLPRKLAAAVEQMTKVTVDTLYAIYVVHIATAVITFLLALPFFSFLGYGHVIFYSVMAAIFQLIPIIGPSIIMIFIGAYALSIGDVRGVILVAVIGYPIVCALPDIYIRPILMGKRASIHPVVMWIGFFGGLAVMGIVGFVLGPLFLALIIAGYGILVRDLKAAGAGAGGA